MDRFPDSSHADTQHRRDSFSLSYPAPEYPRFSQQAPFYQNALPPVPDYDWTPRLARIPLPGSRRTSHSSASKEVLPLRTSRTQKFLTVLALLLTSAVVLAVPLLLLQQTFFSSHPTTPAAKPPLTSLNATALAHVMATPEPPGRTIQPLPRQIMTGVSITGDLTAVEKFEKDAGKKVSVILLYQPWGGTDGEQDFPAAWASSVRQHGSLPMITWEPWVPKSYPADNNEPAYSLKNIIDGKFDHYIIQWAAAAKAWKAPFFLRFAPEMNGNWTPWSEGLNGNKAGDFVRAWRHVHDIFVSVGVTNATWMWCPNIDFPGSLPLSELYPGNAYVDWTGMDGFNWGTTRKYSSWLTFSQVFGSTYKDILSITKKPVMIAETGSVKQGGDEAAWISNAYSVALPLDFPNVKGIVWFDQITQEDWRIEVSPATQAAFFAAMRSPLYASNIFANYMGG